MNELQAIFDASDASPSVKQSALTIALQVAVPIAYQANANQAGGDFLAMLLEILKILLPILLKLLIPV